MDFYIELLHLLFEKGMQNGVLGRDSLQFMGSESETSVMKLCCAAVGHCIGFPLGKLISIINGT